MGIEDTIFLAANAEPVYDCHPPPNLPSEKPTLNFKLKTSSAGTGSMQNPF